ncbi:MAG: hypothetical protein Q9220_002538 [cf. Caloplaca sp. 1 TL-2023]
MNCRVARASRTAPRSRFASGVFEKWSREFRKAEIERLGNKGTKQQLLGLLKAGKHESKQKKSASSKLRKRYGATFIASAPATPTMDPGAAFKSSEFLPHLECDSSTAVNHACPQSDPRCPFDSETVDHLQIMREAKEEFLEMAHDLPYQSQTGVETRRDRGIKEMDKAHQCRRFEDVKRHGMKWSKDDIQTAGDDWVVVDDDEDAFVMVVKEMSKS